ncbi:MAG TPA: hypothetical protein ENK66_01220 [Arcobacter sp.]|nr:hypothetical protein [Arcobacter sp.]
MKDDIKRLERIIVSQNKKLELMRERYFDIHSAMIRTFKYHIEDLDPSISPIEILNNNQEKTIIAFSGMMTQLGMPRAEFFKTLSLHDHINVLFIKDFKQSWYLNGLLGLTNNVEETTEFIKQIIPVETKKIITLGTSSGGYAALLFAELLQADTSIAFAPQTFLNQEQCEHFKSFDSELKNLNFSEYSNLKDILENKSSKTQHNVYFCNQNKRDYIHAYNIKKVSTIHSFDCTSHNIAKILKERNILDKILKSHIL